MIIQYNTDKTINGSQRQRDYFATLVEEELERYNTQITRIEIHLSDENGVKEGVNNILCLIEARLCGRQPSVVTAHSDTIERAMADAIDKLKAVLDTILSRAGNHRANELKKVAD